MSPADRAWWIGRLQRATVTSCEDHVVAVLGRTYSGSGVLKVLSSTGEVEWVKAMGNAQGNQALTTERVVSGISDHLKLPAVDSHIIHIPGAFQGFEMDQWGQYRVVAGPAHASKHVEGAREGDSMKYRDRDSNAQRQAGIFAMWDLFLGQDEQWIYDTSKDYSIWSFDHSLWLTRGEGDWNEELLTRLDSREWQPYVTPAGLDPSALMQYAERLRRIEPAELIQVMNSVPVEWGTTDSDLEALAWFIYRRSSEVADRLEKMSDGILTCDSN
ncbi:hypothetical protein [Nesterenkonia jeotgali]|uniref:Uncharacterized protein n=1 Tax=Nesterenkonia jeotgali TaxID=317018 RepID=A0A839FLU0_9MICC|nr:hypothetical protein [Nesterenkonia jeotgali]MBA8920409.1 hypothetical protein [Nesterenkonia jeotgali]